MRISRWVRNTTLPLFLVAISLPLSAQTYRGGIAGTIHDSSGATLAHAKIALVVVAIGYHHMCRSILRSFEKLQNRRRERWFRVFNEMAVLLFAAIVILVVVKPF